jgi:hypothetical protein
MSGLRLDITNAGHGASRSWPSRGSCNKEARPHALGKPKPEAWQAIAEALLEGGRALVISHGRVIESGAVTCYPHADHATWGAPFGKCEGLRLTYANGAWMAPELLRVPV